LLAREALAAHFAGRDGFTVVGHTANPHGLRRLCQLARPRAALVDLVPLEAASVRALMEINCSYPSVDLIVVDGGAGGGADGGAGAGLLAGAAPAATRGGLTVVADSHGLEAIVRLIRRRASRSPAAGPEVPDPLCLTARERAIVSLMSNGQTTAGIACALRISRHTVDNHKRRIYAKLGVDNQALAISVASALGIAGPPRPGGRWRRPTPVLTAREQDALVHLAQGHTTRQAARVLGIAPKTVENTLARLYRKLGTRNRGETLSVAYRLGLVSTGERAGTLDQPDATARFPLVTGD
jgi:DNA-binding CsgD family transcriptional regulator